MSELEQKMTEKFKNKHRGFKSRNRHDLAKSLLIAIREHDPYTEEKKGYPKTQLIYPANLNFKQLNQYLNILIKNQMITYTEYTTKSQTLYDFRITDKAREYIQYLNKIDSLIQFD